MDIISFAVVGFLGIYVAIYGFELTVGTWGERIPAIWIPEGFRFIPMILGGT